MNTHRQTLFQAVLARLTFGAVPVDGSYWFDPRDAQASRTTRPAAVEAPDADWSPASLSLSPRRNRP